MNRSLLISAIVTFPLLATAATPPAVIHSPSNDGIPHSEPFQIGLDGPHTLSLWLSAGSAATPSVSDQQACVNGVGDEVCGLLAVVRTTGGVTIDSFSADAPAKGYKVDSTTLRIVRLSADEPQVGDLGSRRLGTLTVTRTGPGDVILSDASEYVRADLHLYGLVAAPIAVPEPSQWLQLPAAILGLALLGRLRRRGGANALAALLALGALAPAADAQLYLDRTAFENAIGAGYEFEGFDAVVLDENGWAGFSNGAVFGGGAITWQSLSVLSDMELGYGSGGEFDSGVDGTLLVGTDRAPSPGSYGYSGTPAANDDFRLDFTVPVQAAGISIIGNNLSAGETLEFRDADDNVLVATSLGDGNTYFGYVAGPGEPFAAAIVVEEGTSNDDIQFDDIIWKASVSVDSDPSLPRAKLQDWRQVGPDDLPYAANDRFGVAAAGIGDLDLDGIPDVVVGANGVNDGGTDRGSAWVLFLDRDGSVKRLKKISDTAGGLSGPGDPGGVLADDSQFGRAVASIGDLDGDGVGDLAVGTSPTATAGDLYILFMKRSGEVASFQRIDEIDGGFTGAIDPGDAFGVSVDAIGDLDGDGVVDLAVGARFDDDGGSNTGALWVLFMNADGTVASHHKISALDTSFTGALDPGDGFGAAVTAVGDLDLDGVPDVAVGADRDDDGGTNQGAVWVLFLNDDGSVKDHHKISDSGGDFSGIIGVQNVAQFLAPEDRMGLAVEWIPTPAASAPGVLAIGAIDMNTLWLGGSNQGWGAIFLLTLDHDGNVVADKGGVMRSPQLFGFLPPVPGVFDPPLGEEQQLFSAAHLGDLDGDGFPDVFAGAPTANFTGLAQAGAGYVFFLSGTDATAYADAIAESSVSGATNVLGAPDDNPSVKLDGDTITVQFIDNFAHGNDGPKADLMVYRDVLSGPAGVDEVELYIDASEDGLNFARVFTNAALDSFPDPIATTSRIPVDLDAGGFGSDAEVRFIKIEQIYADTCTGPPSLCPSYPRIDAVEALDNANLTLDSDFDEIPEGIDNCPTVPNPLQEDADSDGVGDVCDNCRFTANPDQTDADSNRKGDLCDGGTLTLDQVTSSPQKWELRYRCPGLSSASTLNVGIVIPGGASNVRFGGPSTSNDCNAPGSLPVLPTPWTAGNGCSNAAEVGGRVDKANSGVVGPGLTGPLGIRSDTLYLAFEGRPENSGFICENGFVAEFIGNLYFDEPVGGVDTNPSFTRRGVTTLGLPPASFTRTGVDPNVGSVELTLSPAEGQTAGTETRWEVCVAAQGEINRLSFTIEDESATTGNMRWLGCETAPDTNLRRTCSGFASQYASRVATTGSCGTPPCPSYTQGPDANGTMFVVLEGVDAASDPPLTKLNVANASSCLGQVEYTGTPGTHPDLSTEGLAVLATQPPILAAVDSQPPFGVPDAVDTADVATTFSEGATSEDTDTDGVRDEDDNCPYFDNSASNWANTGGLLSMVGNDNIGDDCQCGDTDLDGRMLLGGADLGILIDVVLGTNTTTAVRDRCSVIDGKECNIRDGVVMQLGLDGKLPSFEQVCESGAMPIQ